MKTIKSKKSSLLQFYQASLTIILVSLLFVSCNPVKQVLKDQTKFNKVAEEVIRRGYCVNDTIVEVRTDTVYKTDSIVVNTTKFAGGKLDTTFADGSGLYMDDQGNVSVRCPVKQQVRTITKTETIRDRSLENILKSDIARMDSTNKALVLVIKERDVTIDAVKNKLHKRQLQLGSIILALLALIGYRIYRKYRSILPI